MGVFLPYMDVMLTCEMQPPHAATSDVLSAQVDLLWRLAISKGTSSAYNIALQAFHTLSTICIYRAVITGYF